MENKNYIRLWAIDNPVKAIAIVAVGIRLLIAVLYQHITVYPDSEDYILLANRLQNLDLNGYEGQRSPGYPILLSLVQNSFILTGIIQSLCGIVSLIYTYKTLLLTGIKKETALITVLIVSCYIPIVFYEFAILSESLTLLCVTIIFYLFFGITLKSKTNFSNYLLISIACGYLVLIKPFYIFIPILIVIFFLLPNFSTEGKLKKCLIMILLPAFIFLGWSYVNKMNTGYFVSTTFYGFNLSQNCVSFAENTTDQYTEIGHIYARYRDNNIAKDRSIAMSIWEAYPELKEKTGLSFPDLSKKLYDYSLTTIAMNKTGYLKQVGISWLDFWKTSLYYEADSISVPPGSAIIKSISLVERIVFQFVKVIFVILIPFHIVRYFRRRELSPQFTLSVIVFAASLLQAIITYGTNSRFSFPFELLIVISVLLDVQRYRKYRKEKS